MSGWLWLALAIGSEIGGTTALRASDGFTKVGFGLLVIIGYGLSFYAMSIALKSVPLGITYAVWSGVGTVGTLLIGKYVFGDQLVALQYLGALLIVGGVALMYSGGKA